MCVHECESMFCEMSVYMYVHVCVYVYVYKYLSACILSGVCMCAYECVGSVRRVCDKADSVWRLRAEGTELQCLVFYSRSVPYLVGNCSV